MSRSLSAIPLLPGWSLMLRANKLGRLAVLLLVVGMRLGMAKAAIGLDRNAPS
jgi:hypothetical protein